jgi:hypothetical protein
LKDTHPTNWIRLVEWNSENITWLKGVNNKFTRVMDLWLDNIIVRFITEFEVNTAKSYTTTKHDFLKGPRGM